MVSPGKSWKSLKDLYYIRSVTAVTLRFFSLFLSGCFGFANLLLIFRFWGEIITLVLLDNRPTISVLVRISDQLPTLFNDQLSFWTNLWMSAGLLVLSSIRVNILSNCRFTSNCFRLPLYLMSAASLSDLALRWTVSLSLPTVRSGSLWKAKKPHRPTMTSKKSSEIQRRLGRKKAPNHSLTRGSKQSSQPSKWTKRQDGDREREESSSSSKP